MKMRLQMSLMCFMVLVIATQVNSFVGITWGRLQTQQLVPSMVVDMLLQNKIPQLRLMTSGYDIVEIFSGSNISLSVTMGNQFLSQANRNDLAYVWVNDRIKDPINKGVNIVEVTIGSEPFSNSFLKEANNIQIVPVLKLIRDTLVDMKLGHVRATTGHGMDVLKVSKFPSETEFRDDIKKPMLESLQEFNRTGAPFVIYMFPIHFVKEIMNYTMEFAFMDNKSGFKIVDGNITYTNAVELMIDSLAWALKKAGYPNMKIMIGQIGWPTDGYPHANIKNAERFHKGLLKFVASKKGTPLRPGPLDIYLHSLSDENKFRTIYGTFQRHWGIYRADGNPKYKIDFSLQDRDEYPTQAKGIVKMPNRWCKFNGDTSDMNLVNKNYDLSCNAADCTRLEKGASCDGLNFESRISYAFNAYFQKNKQSLKKCDFDGLGQVVATNPSVGNCEFPIEILAFQDQVVQNGMVLRI
ncbi:glucan endo-1,3-beta-glucosidase 8-like [Solanum pennellii]|uniref:Glucan endo-1,3-beta-glucosidase 8-like n=1 Tax=Solanum pennellii TaxID=28526 RepID=A0ABM1GM09_SOLPN|nr:glucan endo-1,3-beta-glucosidase 8-like [Solanum pennellii]